MRLLILVAYAIGATPGLALRYAAPRTGRHTAPPRGRRRVRPYAAELRPAYRPERHGAPTPVSTAPPPVLARVLDGLRRLDDPPLVEELAPLAREVVERRPEVALPAERMEPSPDVVRTEPLVLVGVGS